MPRDGSATRRRILDAAQLRVLRQLFEALLRRRLTPVAYVAELSQQSTPNAQ
jgi:hypothetical protein